MKVLRVTMLCVKVLCVEIVQDVCVCVTKLCVCVKMSSVKELCVCVSVRVCDKVVRDNVVFEGVVCVCVTMFCVCVCVGV